MPKTHNKKRNTGLLYEFLVRSISQALVDGDKRRSSTALKIVKRHFRPGTHLYRELRLINSLAQTTVSSESIAASIIREARAASRAHDVRALDREKSLLISNINRSLGDADFYDQPVKEYRTYATIQTLINDWRDPNRDIGRVAQYEDQLLGKLVAEKLDDPDPALSDEGPGMSMLVMKVMMRRLNEKYEGALTADQRELLRSYALSSANDDPTAIVKRLVEMRDRLISGVDAFCRQNHDSTYVCDKMVQVRERLLAETLDAVDDDTVTRFMLYAKLGDELVSEEA